MHKDAIAIVSQFNAEIRGLYNFYSMAENVSVLNNFAFIMRGSFLKTLAAKGNTTRRKIRLLTLQIFQPPYMVHMDFLGYSSAQFANASFQPSCEAVRLVIFHILRKNIGGQKRKVFLFSETIMIKLALLGKTACESKYGVAMPTL
mgnify:CR=1 FL=1